MNILLSSNKQRINSEFFGRKQKNNEKPFETEMHIDGNKLTLNNFIQETLGNKMMDFLKP